MNHKNNYESIYSDRNYSRAAEIIDQSHYQGADFWGREYKDSVPNKFDDLLKDINEMKTHQTY
jgi:hypothetical protein